MSERAGAVEALRDNFRRRIETAIGGEQGVRILGMFDWAADEVAAAAAPPALDVERLADILHDDIEADGYICNHFNQYLAGKDCGRKALDILSRLAQQDDGPAVAPFTRREYEPPAIRPACRHCSAPELHAAQQDAPDDGLVRPR